MDSIHFFYVYSNPIKINIMWASKSTICEFLMCTFQQVSPNIQKKAT